MPVLPFEAAGRHNSCKGAGDELNLTHSAISRHVRGLEKQLGAELFRTVPKGVELTAAGQDYLRMVTSALDKISAASNQLRNGEYKSLSVTCEPAFASKWLMRHIGEFRSLNPEIVISLVSSGDVVDLRMGKFDLSIRYCTREYTGVCQDPLLEEDVYPYGAPTVAPITDVDDLKQKKLLHEDDGTLWRRWREIAGYGSSAIPSSTGPIPAVLAFEEAMVSSGILLTSPTLAEYDVKEGRLKKLSDQGMTYGSYKLFYPNGSKLSPETNIFRSWLVNNMVSP